MPSPGLSTGSRQTKELSGGLGSDVVAIRAECQSGHVDKGEPARHARLQVGV